MKEAFLSGKLQVGYGESGSAQHAGVNNKIKVFFVVLLVAILVFVGLKSAGVLDDRPKVGDNNINLDVSAPRQRACLITEKQCPAEKNCRAANGGLTGAAAVTSDGHKCCTFGCEDDYIDTRPCKSSETTCEGMVACRMGDNVTMPEAVTYGGRSCCRFACDTGDLPQRACHANSEEVCPPNSYCYDFNGNISVPKARMSNGNSCCQYLGSDKQVCVPLNG